MLKLALSSEQIGEIQYLINSIETILALGLLLPYSVIYGRLPIAQIDYKIVEIEFIVVEILMSILKDG